MRGREVLCRPTRRVNRREIERDPDTSAPDLRPDRRLRGAVREKQLVRYAQRERMIPKPGRMTAVSVPDERGDLRLVDSDPVRYAIAQPRSDDTCELGEPFDRIRQGPAALVLERLRQIPVVERREWPDAALEERIS